MANVIAYGSVVGALLGEEIDWTNDTIKVALVTNSYTPAQDTHDYWDDVSANEASGTGYTAGGKTLANKTSSYDSGTNVHTLDADDVSWTSSTITARYAVIYDDTPATDATKPLIGYLDFGSDQSSSSGTFQVSWHADGILTFTVAAS